MASDRPADGLELPSLRNQRRKRYFMSRQPLVTAGGASRVARLGERHGTHPHRVVRRRQWVTPGACDEMRRVWEVAAQQPITLARKRFAEAFWHALFYPIGGTLC